MECIRRDRYRLNDFGIDNINSNKNYFLNHLLNPEGIIKTLGTIFQNERKLFKISYDHGFVVETSLDTENINIKSQIMISMKK